jgi:cobalt transporter subunit CbtA
MFRNLFFAALVAALCAGLVASTIQHFRVTPLILHAENFEGEGGHSHGEEATPAEHSHAPGTPAHDHGADEWAPQDGWERTLYTVLANLLAAAGFALVIGAVGLLANISITPGNALLWSLAGFASFTLAPAFGLPPELPGMPAADLGARQFWWVATALATGAACLLLAKTRAGWAIAVALALVLAPHIVGAPAAPEEPSAVPAHLATAFAAATIGTSAVFWLVLGVVFGLVNDRLARREASHPIGAPA